MKVPKKIDHRHIIDSVVEVRFIAKNERTSFLDILSDVKDLIPNYSFLTTDIPRQIRQLDPHLQFSVEATLAGENFSLGIGFNALVFNCQNGYKSWSEFYPFIVAIMDRAEKHIKQVSRIGVRFTNFFEGINDLSRFNISFNAGATSMLNISNNDVKQMVLKFSAVKENIAYNVTIANLASIAKRPTPGTLVDVDAYLDKNLPSTVGKAISDAVEYTHSMEKEMFFSLLEKSFLSSLNPLY